MQITVDKVASTGGIQSGGVWYNKDKYCKQDTNALKTGDRIDVELREYNDRQYIKSFTVVSGGSSSQGASAPSSPAARTGGYQKDPQTQLEITRQSSLARATEVYVALLERDDGMKDNPVEFITELADSFVGYVRGELAAPATSHDEDDDFPDD